MRLGAKIRGTHQEGNRVRINGPKERGGLRQGDEERMGIQPIKVDSLSQKAGVWPKKKKKGLKKRRRRSTLGKITAATPLAVKERGRIRKGLFPHPKRFGVVKK